MTVVRSYRGMGVEVDLDLSRCSALNEQGKRWGEVLRHNRDGSMARVVQTCPVTLKGRIVRYQTIPLLPPLTWSTPLLLPG